MAEESQCVDQGGMCVAPPSVEAVEVRHAKALLEGAGHLPLDVARTISAAHFRTLRATNSAGVQRLAGGFVQCPSCSTPWMAHLSRPRLLGTPRNLRGLRRISRRARKNPQKMTRKQKSLLSRYKSRFNVIGVSCLVCRYRKLEYFPLLAKREAVEEVVEVKKTKKKKKKRGREMNAGLVLSNVNAKKRDKTSIRDNSVPTTSMEIDTGTLDNPNSTLDTPRKTLQAFKNTLDHRKGLGLSNVNTKKRDKTSLGDNSVFTTSTEIDTGTLDNPNNTLHAPKSTLHVFKNTPDPRKVAQMRPNFKRRANVVINSVPGMSVSRPADTKVLRDRRKVRSSLKKVMSLEAAMGDGIKGEGKSTNALGAFLDSLF